MSNGDKRRYESPERQRALDAATVLIAYGPDAAAKALHHAFFSEWDGQPHRAILARGVSRHPGAEAA